MSYVDNLVYLTDLVDIPRQGSLKYQLPDRTIALFRTQNDEVFALNDSCPHKKGQLSEGIVHGHRVTCPLHSWVINLQDGKADYPDEGQVACYTTHVEENKVYIQLDQ